MSKQIRFIPHAEEKFGILAASGFVITRDQVIQTVLDPEQAEIQSYRMLAISEHYQLNVVYSEDEETITIVTFFPSRKDRP